ncbi:MAG: iron-sulfur cluster assembly accessory protein [Nitrospirota bacterium]
MFSISEKAAEKIKEILIEEKVPNHALRIKAGEQGCCGTSFEIMIDDKTGDNDTVIEKNGARVFLDQETAKVLENAELNFANDEQGEGFVLNFPGGMPESESCDCGSERPGPSSGCGSGCECN